MYLLLGDDESVAGETPCYIGEADVVSERLRSHEREKDFWDRVVVITSKRQQHHEGAWAILGIPPNQALRRRLAV